VAGTVSQGIPDLPEALTRRRSLDGRVTRPVLECRRGAGGSLWTEDLRPWPTTELTATVSTTTGTTTIRYVRDATDRIVRREASSGYTSVVRYGNSGDGDTADFTLDADNNLIERTIGLLGGVLLTKRGAGDAWSYPNIHGDVMATADAAGAKQGPTLSHDPYRQALGALPDNSAGNFDYGWLGQHQRSTEHEAGIAMGA
jgi:hypothetical protein